MDWTFFVDERLSLNYEKNKKGIGVFAGLLKNLWLDERTREENNIDKLELMLEKRTEDCRLTAGVCLENLLHRLDNLFLSLFIVGLFRKPSRE